jgi:hypothetical protein
MNVPLVMVLWCDTKYNCSRAILFVPWSIRRLVVPRRSADGFGVC